MGVRARQQGQAACRPRRPGGRPGGRVGSPPAPRRTHARARLAPGPHPAAESHTPPPLRASPLPPGARERARPGAQGGGGGRLWGGQATHLAQTDRRGRAGGRLCCAGRPGQRVRVRSPRVTRALGASSPPPLSPAAGTLRTCTRAHAHPPPLLLLLLLLLRLRLTPLRAARAARVPAPRHSRGAEARRGGARRHCGWRACGLAGVRACVRACAAGGAGRSAASERVLEVLWECISARAPLKRPASDPCLGSTGLRPRARARAAAPHGHHPARLAHQQRDGPATISPTCEPRSPMAPLPGASCGCPLVGPIQSTRRNAEVAFSVISLHALQSADGPPRPPPRRAPLHGQAWDWRARIRAERTRWSQLPAASGVGVPRVWPRRADGPTPGGRAPGQGTPGKARRHEPGLDTRGQEPPTPPRGQVGASRRTTDIHPARPTPHPQGGPRVRDGSVEPVEVQVNALNHLAQPNQAHETRAGESEAAGCAHARAPCHARAALLSSVARTGARAHPRTAGPTCRCQRARAGGRRGKRACATCPAPACLRGTAHARRSHARETAAAAADDDDATAAASAAGGGAAGGVAAWGVRCQRAHPRLDGHRLCVRRCVAVAARVCARQNAQAAWRARVAHPRRAVLGAAVVVRAVVARERR